MQILAIILYGKNNKRRVIPFNLGKVNIITGKSKTGKSILGDLIEYCFGGTSCNIAEGFVRDHVKTYALQLVHDGEYIFIARDNPPKGQSSTNKCYYKIGDKEIPENLDLVCPIDNDGLEKLLSSKLGILENKTAPTIEQSRIAFSANIRHALFYCLQNQDEIASQKVLFHRQSEPFIPQAIKDTLPYFLGIVNEESLSLEAEKTRLKREENIISKKIQEIESIKGAGFERAMQLIEEAKLLGMLDLNDDVDFSDYDKIKNKLKSLCDWRVPSTQNPGMDRISSLQVQLQKLQSEIDKISIEIRNAEEYLGVVRGYNSEVEYQKCRLESIGLFEKLHFNKNYVPLFNETITKPIPTSEELYNAINSLSSKLDSLAKERPQLRLYIDDLKRKKQNIAEEIAKIQIAINAVYAENNEAIKLRDLNARKGRVVGRISFWLETVKISENLGEKRVQLEKIQDRIRKIDVLLDGRDIESRKQSISSRLSFEMTKWAKEMDLEHSEYPYRLDFNQLTVMVDKDRPVPLQQLGSGSNWLGCHLISLFALHKFFMDAKSPVPSFLFIDQPSQVYFPPETAHKEVDNKEVREIYNFIFNRVREMKGGMQVIIVDHADLDTPEFQQAVSEKWWNEEKLVPMDWEKL